MNVSSLLDELDEMIDSAWNMPLSGGKALVDAERVREIVDKIRSSLPQEIRQAKAIVSDRSQIIADAKREAETVVRVAEERARVMVNQDGDRAPGPGKRQRAFEPIPDQGQRNPPGRQRVCGRPDEAYGRTDDRQFSGAEENPAKSEGVSEIGQPVRRIHSRKQGEGYTSAGKAGAVPA